MRLGLLATLALAAACSPVTPSPSPAVGPAALSIESRGGPAVVVLLGDSEVARVPCDAGKVIRLDDLGTPPLPWDLRLRTITDGRTLLTTRVTELPQWIVIFGDEAVISRAPIAGPRGPTCR